MRLVVAAWLAVSTTTVATAREPWRDRFDECKKPPFPTEMRSERCDPILVTGSGKAAVWYLGRVLSREAWSKPGDESVRLAAADGLFLNRLSDAKAEDLQSLPLLPADEALAALAKAPDVVRANMDAIFLAALGSDYVRETLAALHPVDPNDEALGAGLARILPQIDLDAKLLPLLEEWKRDGRLDGPAMKAFVQALDAETFARFEWRKHMTWRDLQIRCPHDSVRPYLKMLVTLRNDLHRILGLDAKKPLAVLLTSYFDDCGGGVGSRDSEAVALIDIIFADGNPQLTWADVPDALRERLTVAFLGLSTTPCSAGPFTSIFRTMPRTKDLEKRLAAQGANASIAPDAACTLRLGDNGLFILKTFLLAGKGKAPTWQKALLAASPQRKSAFLAGWGQSSGLEGLPEALAAAGYATTEIKGKKVRITRGGKTVERALVPFEHREGKLTAAVKRVLDSEAVRGTTWHGHGKSPSVVDVERNTGRVVVVTGKGKTTVASFHADLETAKIEGVYDVDGDGMPEIVITPQADCDSDDCPAPQATMREWDGAAFGAFWLAK